MCVCVCVCDTKDLEVKIEHDPDAKAISVTEMGIGMSKAALINKLGAGAESGAKPLLEAMAEGAGANLIGQFGVKGNTKDLEGKIEHDPDSKNMSATSMGIGMPKAVWINNLSTVAKPGTRIHLEAKAEGADTN